MPTLTLKNIPDDLYAQLKETAQVHHRSLNSEILYCIERTICPFKENVAEHLEMAKKLRDKTAKYPISDEEIKDCINEGRP